MKKSMMLFLVCMLVAVGFSACSSGGGGAPAGGPVYDNSKANGTFTYVGIDAAGGFSVDRGTVTFDGAGHGVHTSLTSTDAGPFTYTVTVPGNTLTIDGALIGTLNAAGTFFSAADVSGGSIFMMSGVKSSASFTDTSVTYAGGDFQYSSATGTTAADLFSIVTVTPTDGNLFYSGLTSSGATSYSIATNGSFTIAPAVLPTTFGAISSDKNFMVFADAETVVDPMMSVAVALKLPGFGMTPASLSGTYMGYEFMDSNVSAGPAFEVSRYRLTFAGNGNGTGTVLASSNVGNTGTFTFTYVMAADGTFTITGGPGGTIYGVALQDGSVFAMVDPEPIGDNSIMSFIAIKQ